MKAKWMGALVAAGLFAVPAMAQSMDNSNSSTNTNSGVAVTPDSSSSTDQQTYGGTGGSGLTSDDQSKSFTGTAQTQTDDASVNGTVRSDDLGTGGGYTAGTTDQVTVNTDATTPVNTDVKKDEKNDMRGLVVTLGGGMEGYTGRLRSQIDPGLAWGVTANLKPSKVFGLELGYSGAANEMGNDGAFNDTAEAHKGADIIRNGVDAKATFGLTATPVQPYVMAGLGLNRYSVRATTSSFRDDWSASIPAGLGVRTHIGDFTADLRGTYSFLVDSDFAASEGASSSILGQQVLSAGRWNGMLQLGTTF